ncbi:transcription elongation factor GreA [bacterium]|nr:transcription elongation factor GreA [bacterium]|tara:strand:- start:1097 stop:1564 length:468 start_codon:yes stop_codon:yes gene_type:complete
MPDEKTYLSKEKFEDLKKELEHLKTEKRKEVAESLEYARSLGDLSENAEYQEAGRLQTEVEARIAAIEVMLRSAIIVSDYKGGIINIGSTVTVEKASDGLKQTYKIVGSEETDIEQGKISNKSPIGAALLGREKGETVTVETPGGEVEYRIVKAE